MRIRRHAQFLASGTGLVASVLSASTALAVNPLEFPDNGANQFSRGGAWLATATDPIVAHYNPAALATIASSASIDVRLNYNQICFTRTDENGQPAFVSRASTEPLGIYRKACNARQAFPLTIPAISVAWRATDRLGFGLALVPPAAYGTANEAWPDVAPGIDARTGERRVLPAPYRYQTLGQQTTIIYPTASVGYEPFKRFRIGAGFVSGMAFFNTTIGAISQVNPTAPNDVGAQDSKSNLQVQDLFIPGAVVSLHWSITRYLDVSAWFRWMDAIRSTDGDLLVQLQYYNGLLNGPAPLCPSGDEDCGGARPYAFDDDDIVEFEFPYPPPELRVGARFHMPRSESDVELGGGEAVRDPLHDDLWDIEVDGSYTWNSSADVVKVRFFEQGGTGRNIGPSFLPPIADVATGFKDSYGIRLGGQYNVIRDKLGLMAGTWFETESQKPELMTVVFPGPQRGGVGGGITFRQDFIDFTFGYQYHWSSGLSTRNGLRRSNAGTTSSGFNLGNEPIAPSCDTEECAVARQQFRSFHIVNNGRITQHAHVFALGGVMRF